jgi:hypothetical protein
MIAFAGAKPPSSKVLYMGPKLDGPNKIHIKRLLQERFTNLSENGICGTRPTTEIQDCPLGFAKLAKILSRIPVATLEAAKSLWQHPEIWDEVLDIMKRAESVPFAQFKLELSEALHKANIAPIFQNDLEPRFRTFFEPHQFGIMRTILGFQHIEENARWSKSFHRFRRP